MLMWCGLGRGHDGEHAALLAILPDDREMDSYIFWRAGVPGAREIRQPGLCHLRDDDSGHSEPCPLFNDHPGACPWPVR